MGCCVSRESSPYPPEQPNNPNSSTRAFTASQPQSQSQLPRPSTNASSHSTNHRGSRHGQPALAQHLNQPLKLHVWTSRRRTWTRQELDHERTEFFDTRTTGREEIWLTLRAVLEILWAGGGPEDADGGIATAQMMLNASGITIPSGDLAVGGAYDATGQHYKLPEQIVSDPTNLAPSPDAPPHNDEADKDAESEEPDEDEILRRREEKGKAVVKTKDLVHVRCRLSDGPIPDLVVSIGKDDSVRLLAKKLLEEAKLPPPKHIKIVYLGKVLKENQSLLAQGWKDDHVVNAMVFG